MRFEFHYLTLKASVQKADKYKYLEWKFDSITQDSVIDSLAKTKETISNLNTQYFPSNFDRQMNFSYKANFYVSSQNLSARLFL